MAKYLVEYNGVPAVLKYDGNIKKVSYVVAWVTEDKQLIKQEFENVDRAIEFKPNSIFRLDLIRVDRERYDFPKYYQLSTNVDKEQITELKISDRIEIVSGNHTTTLRELHHDASSSSWYSRFRWQIAVIHYLGDAKRNWYGIDRRNSNHNKSGDLYSYGEYYEDYLEIVPPVEDLALELLFVSYVIATSPGINSLETLEAKLMQ